MLRSYLTSVCAQLQDLRIIDEDVDFTGLSLDDFSYELVEGVIVWFMNETRNETHHQATLVFALRLLPLSGLVRYMASMDLYEDFDIEQRMLLESAIDEAFTII